ncbi:uncharacterized protein LOC117108880 [Anneissia japonica]|uniref:uncharacterized protein LOC117108880 n=1 Tax=Anneissia japonica TaxID=1529436 RepID=UPI0014259BC8|nr:uncharacterized protein LOC117108880 [Anneissia japonica]
MALVANYGTDSESEVDEEETFENTRHQINEESTTKNLLTVDDSTDSEPESSQIKKESAAKKQAERLPLPLFMDQSESTDMKKLPNSSVFRNPFEEAEHEQFSILEKHVKMTHMETNSEQLKKGKKNVCYSFRNGRCRFGDKCRFSHSLEASTDTTSKQNMNSSYNERIEYEFPKDGNNENVEKRKRRAGLSKTLIPPKKAMKSYERTQAEERPWTLNN